ncbi:histidine kinase N-terminal 7TM domain-containing diguanylate cyclase [Paenibacillus mendelii]|uniref:Diguanylate cyclase n=1 Tax=Paenibacillus mendelii TaxID=206163 RepID=A0ABV6JMW8_9BACL|nr:diguanylate cyclase [Paenibacillus mendelii]MCQ6558824.1 diguanylate cyclase [Paenibacillus mendelii]
MTWMELSLFLILFALFVYIFLSNHIVRLHKTYLLFHFFMMLWPFGQFAVRTTDYPQFQQIYITISFVGMSLLGFGWFLFTLTLTDRIQGFTGRSLVYLSLPAVLSAVSIIFNPGGGFVTFENYNDEHRFGPLFWIMFVQLLAYGVYSLVLLLRSRHSEILAQERPRIANAVTGILILVGFGLLGTLVNVALAPWLPRIPYLMSLGTVMSGIYFVFAIQRHGMFDIIQFAQQDVFDTISAGIIVLDDQDHVLELNRFFQPQLQLELGKRFDMEHFLASTMNGGGKEEFLSAYRSHLPERAQTEITMQTIGGEAHFALNAAPILVNKKMIGRVITLQDVTELRSLVAETHSKNEALRDRNRALILMQDELFQANRKLEQMAITDSLTGCYNRRYLMLQLEHEVATNIRYGIPFAIFLFDIDLFKKVNDTYGHLVGDEVIRLTAKVVKDALRKTDILARYGGEEFTVYLPHTNREQAEMLANRIRSAVERHEYRIGKQGETIHITISMGMMAVEGQPGQNLDDPKLFLRDLFAKADAALYRAKEDGRNRIVNM